MRLEDDDKVDHYDRYRRNDKIDHSKEHCFPAGILGSPELSFLAHFIDRSPVTCKGNDKGDLDYLGTLELDRSDIDPSCCAVLGTNARGERPECKTEAYQEGNHHDPFLSEELDRPERDRDAGHKSDNRLYQLSFKEVGGVVIESVRIRS